MGLRHLQRITGTESIFYKFKNLMTFLNSWLVTRFKINDLKMHNWNICWHDKIVMYISYHCKIQNRWIKWQNSIVYPSKSMKISYLFNEPEVTKLIHVHCTFHELYYWWVHQNFSSQKIAPNQFKRICWFAISRNWASISWKILIEIDIRYCWYMILKTTTKVNKD